ncbi:MAG: YihY/virulence factor BrkB family protein [candidate division Zixibacteria bacterium]|nr:YihY/virulence factor BrkB family protein [candidate division Zixibacteria bacterium]
MIPLRLKPKAVLFWEFLKEVYIHTFHKDNVAVLAAAISFYTLLSVVPLILVIISVSGILVHSSDEIALTLFTFISSASPAVTGQALELLSAVVDGRHLFGLLGIIALGWTASRVFAASETAMNLVWKPAQPRPFWRSRLLSLALVPFSLVIILISFLWTILNSLARQTTVPFLEIKLSDTFFFTGMLPILLPILLSFVMFVFIYRVLPNSKPSLLACSIGAAFAGISWEILKLLFDYYIKQAGNINRIYGSLGGIIVMVLWVYYSAYILIIGAEVAANFERFRTRKAESAI